MPLSGRTSAALTSLGGYDVIGNQLQQLIPVHRNAITIIPLAHTETLSSNGADQRAGGEGLVGGRGYMMLVT